MSKITNILCFGDSNTYGYVPVTRERYPRNVRWPGRLQELLGEDYYIVEEGCNGRTTVHKVPGEEWRCGIDNVKSVIYSHLPLDIVTVMLGSNDLKTRFHATAKDIALGAEAIVKEIIAFTIEKQGFAPKIVLISPPEIGPGMGVTSNCSDSFDVESVVKSKEFPPYYRAVAERNGCVFVDAAQIVKPSEADSLHLMPEEHEKMAVAMAEVIRTITDVDCVKEEKNAVSEFIDICDENGQPTGEVVERSVAHAEGVRHRTAHVWVIRKTDAGAEGCETGGFGSCEDGSEEQIEVLLQKRSMNKDSFPGQYDTSSAGHIPAGTEPRESAVRELEEELGIVEEAEELKYIGTFSAEYEEMFYGKVFHDNEYVNVFVYDKPVEIDKLTIQEEELECVKWFGLEEVLKAVAEDDDRFCVPPKGLAVLNQYIKSIQCPCCERHYFSEKDAYEICPVCGWEDDKVQRKDATFEGGANEMSLEQARAAYKAGEKAFGCGEEVR